MTSVNNEEFINALEEILQRKLNSRILNQIKRFKECGLTEEQIVYAVCFWFEIKGTDKKTIDEMGIAIVPSIYKEAEAYFKEKQREYREQKEKGKIIQNGLNNRKEILVKKTQKRHKERRVASLDEF